MHPKLIITSLRVLVFVSLKWRKKLTALAKQMSEEDIYVCMYIYTHLYI